MLACILSPFFCSSLLPALNETKDKQPAFAKQLENDRSAVCKCYCCTSGRAMPETAHLLTPARCAFSCTDTCCSNRALSISAGTKNSQRLQGVEEESIMCCSAALSLFLSPANLRAGRCTSKGREALLPSMEAVSSSPGGIFPPCPSPSGDCGFHHVAFSPKATALGARSLNSPLMGEKLTAAGSLLCCLSPNCPPAHSGSQPS